MPALPPAECLQHQTGKSRWLVTRPRSMPRSRTQKPRFPRPSKSGLTERIPKRRTHRGVLQGQAKDLFTCPEGAEGAPCPPRGWGTASSDSPPAGRASPPRPHPGLALTLTALHLSSFTTPLLFPAPTPRVAVGLRSELLSSLDSGGLSGPRLGTSGLQGRQISFLGACFLLISVSSVLPGLTPYACDCLFSPEAALKEPHSEPGGGGGPRTFCPSPKPSATTMHLPTSYEAGQLGGGRAGSGRPVRGGQRTTGPGRRDPTPGARQAPDAQLGSANSARRSGGDARPARPAWVSLRATAGPAPSLKGPPRLHEAAEPRCPSDPGRMETWSWPHLTWVFLARSSPRGLLAFIFPITRK